MVLNCSSDAGFAMAPLGTTVSPEMIFFTATSTFFPLIVYYTTEAGLSNRPSAKRREINK